MKNIKSKIIENREISHDFYYLKFTVAESAVAQAGQFLTMKIADNTAPLLRRPFAYSGFDKESMTAEIIYQRRGPATELLCKKVAGDEVSILGPLGNSFPIPGISKQMKNAKGIILIAGGIGLGPILFMAKTCLEKNIPVTMVAGFRTAEFVPTDQFLLPETAVCTDDGTSGFNGNVVQYLNTIDKETFKDNIVISCGPLPMMKAINSWADENKLESWVSMEEMMGCGVGACMGCVVDTNDEKGYARVCVEGPVFNSKVIKWS